MIETEWETVKTCFKRDIETEGGLSTPEAAYPRVAILRNYSIHSNSAEVSQRNVSSIYIPHRNIRKRLLNKSYNKWLLLLSKSLGSPVEFTRTKRKWMWFTDNIFQEKSFLRGISPRNVGGYFPSWHAYADPVIAISRQMKGSTSAVIKISSEFAREQYPATSMWSILRISYSEQRWHFNAPPATVLFVSS